MLAIRLSKNRYKFVNIDRLKVRAFNVAAAGLAVYGLIAIITK